MQVACGGGIHDEWTEWEQRARVRGLARRLGAEAADNAWGVVCCDEAGARDRSGGGGKGGGLKSASPTTTDPDRNRADE